MKKLLIATANIDKFREIKEILKDLPCRMSYLGDFPQVPGIVEDGKTFLENAAKKAMSMSRISSLWTLADDSGLEVRALNGKPGVFSARFAGTHASYDANNRKLLRQLRGVARKERNARFVCCVALARSGMMVKHFMGFLNGMIAEAPVGKNGFGYDPVFFLPKYQKTLAELSPEFKNSISHRFKAFIRFKEYFLKYLEHPDKI